MPDKNNKNFGSCFWLAIEFCKRELIVLSVKDANIILLQLLKCFSRGQVIVDITCSPTQIAGWTKIY